MKRQAPLLILALAAGLVGFLLGRGVHEQPPADPPSPPPQEEPIPGCDPLEGDDRPHPSSSQARQDDSVAPIPQPASPPPEAAAPQDLYEGSLVHTPHGTLRVIGSGGEYRLVREGPWLEFHPDGSRRSQVEYRSGVLEGPATFWHQSGHRREEGHFSGGKKQGTWTTWDEKGNRISEGEWENGALAGPLRLWEGSEEFLPEAEAIEKAEVDGKYRGLLARIAAPQDRERYAEFHDYGHFRKTDYLGHREVPAGYWVYVYPYWYVWRESSADATSQDDATSDLLKHIDRIRR